MSSRMRRGTSSKLSQNNSTIAAIMRLSPVADHLREVVPHPLGRARVLDAIRQALGDPEPLLDRRQQQYPGVRGHPAAVESDMHRLARDRWQTRQNPRTFVHGGRELRWPRLIRFEQPNHTRIQRLMSLPPPSSCSLMNYPG